MAIARAGGEHAGGVRVEAESEQPTDDVLVDDQCHDAREHPSSKAPVPPPVGAHTFTAKCKA